MAFDWGLKDPDEQFEVQHDWQPRFLLDGADTGDALILPDAADAAARPTAEVVTEGSTLEVYAIVAVPDSAKLQYWLRGGTAGEKAKIVLTVNTAQGRIFQESATVKIKEV